MTRNQISDTPMFNLYTGPRTYSRRAPVLCRHVCRGDDANPARPTVNVVNECGALPHGSSLSARPF